MLTELAQLATLCIFDLLKEAIVCCDFQRAHLLHAGL